MTSTPPSRTEAVSVVATILDLHPPVVYPACLICRRRVVPSVMDNVWQCLHCSSPSSWAWRYRLHLTIADSSASLPAICFGKRVEAIFGLEAHEFLDLFHGDSTALRDYLIGSHFIFCIGKDWFPSGTSRTLSDISSGTDAVPAVMIPMLDSHRTFAAHVSRQSASLSPSGSGDGWMQCTQSVVSSMTLTPTQRTPEFHISQMNPPTTGSTGPPLIHWKPAVSYQSLSPLDCSASSDVVNESWVVEDSFCENDAQPMEFCVKETPLGGQSAQKWMQDPSFLASIFTPTYMNISKPMEDDDEDSHVKRQLFA